MASETWVQNFVHRLEEGGWATWVRRILLGMFVLFVITWWMFFSENGFKGMSHEFAMDQAQISREIARGNGFSTKLIRPAALYQFRENTGRFDLENTPDTYHAPLNPLLNAPFLKLAEKSWRMGVKDVVAPTDFVLVCVQFAWMILGWVLSYLAMKRLFDKRLAVFGVWMLILCQTFWDFALSGLPQNLMFALFAGAIYCLVRAVENRVATKATWRWLLGCALCFGLLALTHALTLWLAAGALVFVAIYFPPRWLSAGVFAGVLLLCYTPWLVRNAKVCGNPVGLGWYAGLSEVKGSENSIMRSMEPPFQRVSPRMFLAKARAKILHQASQLIDYLGGVMVAPLFFIALLHLFKRRETSVFRWALLLMWIFGVIGMSIFGLTGKPMAQPFAPPVEANDLHMLFIPMFAAYGLAFVLVLWSRVGITVPLVRFGFIALLFILSSLRFLGTCVDLAGDTRGRVQWPPYVPPFIGMLSDWTTERELIASDVPWAVAWYGDRKSLWLPISVQNFIELNDYNKLNGHVVGLYLTPYSGNRNFVSDIIKGDYKEWAVFITRQIVGPALRDFPLREVTPMPLDNECVFYADRNRWTPRED
ncbi:MAG: glycosyltransferase family 39 protein [Chthoniobacteraceae bacterium]